MAKYNYGRIMMLLTHIMSIFFPATLAVDPDCNFNQQMQSGVTYYVYNPEYPNYYPPNRNCKWIATAPTGYKIQLNCSVEMPSSQGCSLDKLLVSTTGDENLQNAHLYCGKGNFQQQSESTKISIGLLSAWNSPGGRFLCTMSAVQAQQCDCGWRNTRRIVGGVETKVNEYPSMAGLVDFLLKEVYCGATIIAVKYAVTAAHCTYNKQATAVGLLVGDHNLTSGAETPAARLLVVSRFIMHPLYDPNDALARNDIAVVETQTNIQFNQLVGPCCLPFRYYTNTFTGQSAELLGWGTTEFTGPKSDVLLKTDVNVVDPTTCQDKTGGNVDQLCTFKQGHDACQADSGGPVLWTDTNSYRTQLIGIISTGLGCASSTPALNTRVTAFLNWILSVTPDVDYCVK